jgi:hypothetical protein|tara:strand:- start:184 stop:783 length:600 start_codon:yes stop_codon:yes gene_type:complete
MASNRRTLAICDTCGFQYPHRVMKLNSYGLLVCPMDFEGPFDLKNSPLNRAPNVSDNIRVRNPRPPTTLDRNIQWGSASFVWDNVFKTQLPTDRIIVMSVLPKTGSSPSDYQFVTISVPQSLTDLTDLTFTAQRPSTTTASGLLNGVVNNNITLKLIQMTGTIEVGMEVTGTNEAAQDQLVRSWQPSNRRKQFSLWSSI